MRLSFGWKLAPKNEANVKTRRDKEGRCPECGNQTHLVHGLVRKVKTPLDVPGVAFRGRCLLCRPLPSTSSADPQQQHTSVTTTAAPEAGNCDLAMLLEEHERFLPTNSEVQRWFQSSWKKELRVTEADIPSRVHTLKPSSEVISRFRRAVQKLGKASNIEFLWHGTSSIECANGLCGSENCSLCSIATHGFRPQDAKTGTSSFRAHGKTVYFADKSVLAHGYNGQNEDCLGCGCRMVILSAVARGATLDMTALDHKLCYLSRDRSERTKIFHQHVGRPPLQVEWELLGEIPWPRHPGPTYQSMSRDPLNSYDLKHYMITDGSLAIPLYTIVYQYPVRYQTKLPEGIQGTTCEAWCSHHRMYHSNTANLDCDASYGTLELYRKTNDYGCNP